MGITKFDFAKFVLHFFGVPDFETLAVDAAKVVIKRVQERYGFQQTGELTPELEKVLSAGRRCGNSDASRMGSGWYKPGRITYCIDAYLTSPFMNPEQFTQGVRWAFDRIEEACGYSFEQVETTDANFLITWGRGARAGFPENGPGGVLAHCQLAPVPNYTGQVRCVFDGAEPWVFDENARAAGSRILINLVALHEFLHGIGLEHVSEGTLSILNPVYNPNLTGLTDFDVNTLRSIAGPPRKPTNPDYPVPSPRYRGSVRKVSVCMEDGTQIDTFPR